MEAPSEGMGMLPPTPVKNSNRVVGLTVVAVIHVILIYALASGLAKTAISVIKGPLEAALLQQQQQADLPPPPPPKVDDLPQSNFVPPDIDISAPPAITEAPKAVAPPPSVAVAAAVSQAVTTAPKVLGKAGVSPDQYPPVSRRLGEEGTVVVKVTVSAEGAVSECAVAKGSGHDRLDNAACGIVKSTYHFSPGTSDGKPAAESTQIAVQFKLT